MQKVRLSLEQVEQLCPECAVQMRARNISALKLYVFDPDPTEPDSIPELKFFSDDGSEDLKLFAGFSKGLCERFGADEGFFTRCEPVMAKHVDDAKGFCASLKHYCTGHWPGEKKFDKADLKVESRDGKWVIIDGDDASKLMGTYATKEQADAACAKMRGGDHKTYDAGEMRGFMCSKCGQPATKKDERDEPFCDAHAPQHAKPIAEADYTAKFAQSIKGIEIFGTGTHNGDDYTESDIDEIISSFKDLDFRPALKVGHSKDTPGAPAYGWVQNLRKEKSADGASTKLVADFTDMDDSVVDALRKRRYDRVSSEIYFNLKRGGKQFKRALKAVALLGAEVPAVAGLKPLHKVEFAESGFERVATASEAALSITADKFFEALHERNDRLINFIKEFDMARNTDAIKALKAQVTDLEGKMTALKGKEETTEFKELSAQTKKIADKVSALEAADASEAQTAKELSEAKAALAAAAEREKSMGDRVAKLEQKEREQRLGEKLKACKIPAMRPGLSALYEFATTHADAVVKIFSTDAEGKSTSKEVALAEIVDTFVGVANEMSEKLFKALAVSGQARAEDVTDDNASAEVAKRVKAYQLKNPQVKSYEVAMKSILAEDPELAKSYRDQFSGTEQ